MHYVIYLSYKGKLQFYFDVEFQIEFGTLFFLFLLLIKNLKFVVWNPNFMKVIPLPPQKNIKFLNPLKLKNCPFLQFLFPVGALKEEINGE